MESGTLDGLPAIHGLSICSGARRTYSLYEFIDPNTPAGFVGAQGPGPWGGFDYAKLSRAVQWTEDYDFHGSNEILRSFWNDERRPIMKTFFSTKDPKLDSWFLWYYMLHGNQAVIAWPEGWFRIRWERNCPIYLGE